MIETRGCAKIASGACMHALAQERLHGNARAKSLQDDEAQQSTNRYGEEHTERETRVTRWKVVALLVGRSWLQRFAVDGRLQRRRQQRRRAQRRHARAQAKVTRGHGRHAHDGARGGVASDRCRVATGLASPVRENAGLSSERHRRQADEHHHQDQLARHG